MTLIRNLCSSSFLWPTAPCLRFKWFVQMVGTSWREALLSIRYQPSTSPCAKNCSLWPWWNPDQVQRECTDARGVALVDVERACEAEGSSWSWVNHSSMSHPPPPESDVCCSYAILIVSNQAINSTALNKWKRKISLIATAVCSAGFVPYYSLIEIVTGCAIPIVCSNGKRFI